MNGAYGMIRQSFREIGRSGNNIRTGGHSTGERGEGR